MALQPYTPSRANAAPTARISSKGSITFNKMSSARFDLSRFTHAVLYYDPDTDEIAINPTMEAGGLAVKARVFGRGWEVSQVNFFRNADRDILPAQSLVRPVEWREAETPDGKKRLLFIRLADLSPQCEFCSNWSLIRLNGADLCANCYDRQLDLESAGYNPASEPEDLCPSIAAVVAADMAAIPPVATAEPAALPEVPTCSKCGKPKTRAGKSSPWKCKPCNKAYAATYHANRRTNGKTDGYTMVTTPESCTSITVPPLLIGELPATQASPTISLIKANPSFIVIEDFEGDEQVFYVAELSIDGGEPAQASSGFVDRAEVDALSREMNSQIKSGKVSASGNVYGRDYPEGTADTKTIPKIVWPVADDVLYCAGCVGHKRTYWDVMDGMACRRCKGCGKVSERMKVKDFGIRQRDKVTA